MGKRLAADVGRFRGRWLRWLVMLTPSLAAASACDRPDYTYSDDVPVANGASSSIPGFGGKSTTGGSAPIDMCALERVANGSPIFSKQTVSNALPAHADVYLQVTDAEAEELKQGAPLIKAPVAGAGDSMLTRVLNQLLTNTDDLRRPLVQMLQAKFKNTRATWPNPWALRLIDHPGSEHMNPVRIRLNPDAWIVSIKDTLPFQVVNVQNAQVQISDAIQHPERIAAVYYVANTKTLPFSADVCNTGKRELALGNVAMVDSFELGTPEILERLNGDIAALNALFTVARGCSNFDRGGVTFQAYTVCQAWEFFDPTREYSAYQWSLSNPVELYKPTPQNLGSLVQALKDDVFVPDPFVGVPTESMGSGGEPGAAGAGGASGAATGGDATQAQGGAF